MDRHHVLRCLAREDWSYKSLDLRFLNLGVNYLKSDVGNYLLCLDYVWRAVTVFFYKQGSVKWSKLVRNVRDSAMNRAWGMIFYLRNLHPRQISAAHYLLVSTVKIAVVALYEILMPLVKVNYLISKLRNIKVIDWVRLCLLKMSFWNLIPNFINLIIFKFCHQILLIFLQYMIIVFISTE